MYYETDHLSHHGVKGQKWGVRRYQNKDGTLTEAGKKHQVDTDSESTKMKKDVKDAYDKIAKEFNKYQDILGGTRFETMDDDELRELVIMDIKEAHGVDLSDLYEDYIKKRNKTLSHSEDDHLEHRYHKYIKKYWVDGKWRYVYADKGDHQKLESYASDYKNYSKIARSTTDSYRRRTQWETKARESENKFIYLMNKRSIKTITKKEIEVGRSYLTNLLKKIGNRII